LAQSLFQQLAVHGRRTRTRNLSFKNDVDGNAHGCAKPRTRRGILWQADVHFSAFAAPDARQAGSLCILHFRQNPIQVRTPDYHFPCICQGKATRPGYSSASTWRRFKPNPLLSLEICEGLVEQQATCQPADEG